MADYALRLDEEMAKFARELPNGAPPELEEPIFAPPPPVVVVHSTNIQKM